MAVGLAPLGDSPAIAATSPKPEITQDARSALAQMGTALLAKEFSFHARTIEQTRDRAICRSVSSTNSTCPFAGRTAYWLTERVTTDRESLMYDYKTVVLAPYNGKLCASPAGAQYDLTDDVRRDGPLRP